MTYPHGERRGGKVIAEYVYEDESGEPYHKVERTEDKQFPQSRWVRGIDGFKKGHWEYGAPEIKVPYFLRELIKTPAFTPIFITEGEKDTETLINAGFVATCNSGGACKWTADLNKWFKGRQRVYILADNDVAGRDHAVKVAQELSGIVAEVRIVELPGLGYKEDVTDWFEKHGGTKQQLIDLCAATPLFQATVETAADFERDDDGKIISRSQHNIRLALKLLKIEIKFNRFDDRMLITGLDGFELLDDAAIERLWLLIDEKFKFMPGKDFFFTVVMDTARRKSFHPVLDYLYDLEWDRVPRVDKWLTTHGNAKDTPYVSAVGALMLIAAVRRVRKPGCKFDEMPVFESQQGLEKSTMLATLAVNPDWFSDDLPLGADSKKMIEHLRGRWIVEAAELKGMRKADVEHLKSFLSRQRDRARMSYDRTMTELPRQCIVVGTTNHKEYLRDLTGNRRYWPVEVGAFDLEAIKRDRDQLWAEALVREIKGESIRLDSNLWKEAAEEQSERTIDDPWIETITNTLGDLKGKILANDAWKIVGLTNERRTQDSNARFGHAMRAAGWERKKLSFDGQNKWGYVRGDTGEERGHRIFVEAKVGEETRVSTTDQQAPL